mmetsp:Transcript_20717/g.48940  ORF Transcript_20717/g.48940 Transcript_20717/m.48940 type:complete len:555 (+) Transcript_20717:115-1779(+)
MVTTKSSASGEDTKAAAARVAAETVIAETAGRDTWQTWAGRKHGMEGFEVLDIFRGFKHSINHSLGTKLPKQGTTCPICFCEPDNGESPSSFWHVTWCGHAVCRDCFGQYAINHVRDREQSGPLKCPVCLKTLRKQDAVVAMMAGKRLNNSGDADLIKQWDVKIRDQLLRALPSYRSCPKCGNSSNGNDVHSKRIGGGFVTPECLEPQHQQRREKAIEIMMLRNYAYVGVLISYFLLVGIIAWTKSASAQLDLVSMLLPIYVFMKLGMNINYLLATKARQALFRSITVQCPCCDESFVLPVESKELEDEETSRWVNANTRRCPSCSVPISKTGGCNHMRCLHCGANFCWACMRLQTECQAYRCQNGAPYRNASIFDAGEEVAVRRQALNRDGSVLSYIDHILNHRICPELTYGDGLLVLVCLAARHFQVAQVVGEYILSSYSVQLFGTMSVIYYIPHQFRDIEHLLDLELRDQILNHIVSISLIFLVSNHLGVTVACGYLIHILQTLGQQEQEQQRAPEREQERRVVQNPDQLLINTLNENMLNEALQRSIEET